MKTEFELDSHKASLRSSVISIVGEKPKSIPYVHIQVAGNTGVLFIKDRDLELFAVNILKALKSKHLKS